jgi:hypothetical protein
MPIPDPTADAARPDPRATLAQVPLGRRVVVRSLIEDGERATDAVGELIARDRETVTVRARSGTVRIELARVVLAKEVPPGRARAWRVPPFLRRGGVAVLTLDGVVRDRDHGTPIGPTAALVDELTAAGRPTFLLADGTDRVPTELEQVGLTRLVPALLDAHTLGADGPSPEAFLRVHTEIESRLGRTVGRAEVHFTDARPAHVDAARACGWQARVFTLPPDGALPGSGRDRR